MSSSALRSTNRKHDVQCFPNRVLGHHLNIVQVENLSGTQLKKRERKIGCPKALENAACYIPFQESANS